MKLNELKDKPGARQARKRVGRGRRSCQARSRCRGVKGQGSRSGVAIKGFEGGQMPIYRRLPKRGFTNEPFRKQFNEVNLGRVQAAVDAKRLDPKQPVTLDALMAAGVIGKRLDGVRLLGTGTLKTKLAFVVDHASKSAAEAVEKLGGSITITEARTPEAAVGGQ